MTTKSQISAWFDRGIQEGHLWMLVVCDTFDHEDYPVYTSNEDECINRYNSPGEMQRVMEVYDLREDKEPQLNEHRTLRLPVKDQP